MGTYIDFNNYIHISIETHDDNVLKYIGYKDVDDEFIQNLLVNKKVKWVQISEPLPDEAYSSIDRILEARPDMTFRIFHLLDSEQFDISFLFSMTHLRRLRIDTIIGLRDNPNIIDFQLLERLPLKSLSLECFGLKDYSFIKNLSEELEELMIYADTQNGSVNYDNEWLLKYRNLHTLWIGGKTNKHFERLCELQGLRSLSMRGIKIKDFTFLKKMNLDKLSLLWNSNNDLHELSELSGLKEIELWRINKLEDISFIESLVDLEVIKLQDLKHIKTLPNLNNHKKLKHIYLIDTGIDETSLPETTKKIVEHWDNR